MHVTTFAKSRRRRSAPESIVLLGTHAGKAGDAPAHVTVRLLDSQGRTARWLLTPNEAEALGRQLVERAASAHAMDRGVFMPDARREDRSH